MIGTIELLILRSLVLLQEWRGAGGVYAAHFIAGDGAQVIEGNCQENKDVPDLMAVAADVVAAWTSPLGAPISKQSYRER